MSFYAVKCGDKPGIYKTWNECKKQVNGIKGAKYKKFNNINDAKKFIDNDIISNTKYGKHNGNKKNNNHNRNDNHKIENNTLYIFTDGGSSNNGSKSSIAGSGIYIPQLNIEKTIKLSNGSTNNFAELTAICKALKIYEQLQLPKYKEKIKTVFSSSSTLNYNTVIVTDSKYSIQCITEWFYSWEKNNWKKSDGQLVKNLDLIKFANKLITKHNIKFKHINSHTNKKGFFYEGNAKADYLASNF